MCGHRTWGQAVCAHESLARLQLPLKCSSDQDEREGSPSPSHLALIAGRNASPRSPGGGARRSLPLSSLIPRLSAGLARRARAREQKGVSAGQPEIGDLWGVRTPPLAAPGCWAPQAWLGMARAAGGLPVVPISGFSGSLEPAGPLTRAFSCQCGGRGDEERGNSSRPRRLAGCAVRFPAPPAGWSGLPWPGSVPAPPGVGLTVKHRVPLQC